MKGQVSTYTFLEEHKRYIQPTIEEIDIFLKTAEHPFQTADVACVLDISKDEVLKIMAEKGIKTIDEDAFFTIMSAGSNRICVMYAREIEIGSPATYTAAQIAYIYNLDEILVKDACHKLQIKEVTAFTMPLIFANIPYDEL